ncbi:non-specific lipid transfer protein GPI-anchored 25-like [Lolium rigidum]|uniref:non-specific lipid transfer protein GPI-anchored 25-like n=1 Tax=Lolium rigidum TaxID=89674 RepID=UPI001F5D18E7|nr:non-specific lipid transfer protein GPI-anchored 25-like [Lolium rigidum]
MAPTAALLLVSAAAILLAPAVSAATSEVPPATPCAAAIVSFSPCLAHVALVEPPALPAPAPTAACCAAFLRAVSAGDGEGGGGEGCFCYLLRDPLLLGFPVDLARLGALLPTCASANASPATTVEAETLFADKCRELKSLPEMHFAPPSPPPTPPPPSAPKISPATVEEPASPPPEMEEHSTSTPVTPADRSGSDALCACRVFLVALVFAAAVLITLQF